MLKKELFHLRKEKKYRTNKGNYFKRIATSIISNKKIKTKERNTFANKMSIHIKLSEVQISKLFQSGRSLGSWFGKVVGKPVRNLGKKKSNIELWCSFS